MSSPGVFNNHPSPFTMESFHDTGDGHDPDAECQQRMMQGKRSHYSPGMPRRLSNPSTVKVLYTFDDENKSNCLARLPGSHLIPVLFAEDNTPIGIFDLRSCIRTIVKARCVFQSLSAGTEGVADLPWHSPDLELKLNQFDFIVHSTDFSEQGRPTESKGLLSEYLATTPPTHDNPAVASETRIIGRVCKNLLAGFTNNGPRETLEVKLKLIPFPRGAQNEADKSMDTTHIQGRGMSGAFESGSSTEYMYAGYADNAAPAQNREPQWQRQQASMGGQAPCNRNGAFTPIANNGFSNSRPASPAGSCISMNHTMPMDANSRPSSRASTHQVQADYIFDDPFTEDGPMKKRAKLTQTEWQGRPTFGSNSESLRVTASTAASIRGFRPLVEHSAVASDLGPRAPTPRPFEKRKRQSLVSQASSGLRRESTASDHHSPYPQSDCSIAGDGQTSHAASSPDMPSSPPPGFYNMEGDAPPSSPLLPELPIHADSGFQSGYQSGYQSGFQSGFQSDLPTDVLNSELPLPQGVDQRAIIRKEKWRETRQKTIANTAWENLVPDNSANLKFVPAPTDPLLMKRARSAVGLGDPVSSPTTHRPLKPAIPRKTSAAQPTNEGGPLPASIVPTAASARPSSSQLPIEASAGPRPVAQMDLPATSNLREPSLEASAGPRSKSITMLKKNPLSRQGKRPTTKRLPRSNTWSGHASSDVESDGTRGGNVISQSRNGSGSVRQTSIKNQLQSAVAAGELPRFCNNCGAIQTPTWRPYWIRVEYGTGDDVDCGQETGIHCVEPLSRDDQGKVLTYRIYKQWSFLSPEEKESNMFEQCILCNPCGGFLKKWGRHRPENMWDQNPSVPAELVKKNNRGRKKVEKTKGYGLLSSDIFQDPTSNIFTDIPMSDAVPLSAPVLPESRTPSVQPDPTAMPPPQITQDSSAPSQWNDADAAAALQRAIQPSPSKAIGSKESPINLDEGLTPKPVRRTLFPSPRKEGEFKSLGGDQYPEVDKGKPDENSSTEKAQSPSSEDEADQLDKENCPPPIDENDDLAHLFDFSNTPNTSPNNAPTLPFLRTPLSKSRPSREPLVSLNDEFNSDALPESLGLHPQSSPLALKSQPQLTPTTLHINKLLSEGVSQSPSRNFNFNEFFSTPVNIRSTSFDFNAEDLFGDMNTAEFTMPSSPPMTGSAYFENLFEFYEDATATEGISGDMTGQENEGASTNSGRVKDGTEGEAQGDDIQVQPLDITAILGAVTELPAH
jgi:hypothetical protein